MSNERILIVDDDAELCDEMAEMLRFEGYPVENTSDPREGAELLKNGAFQLVILDFKMPGINGIDLIRMIKGASPQTAVLLITGKPFIEKLLEEEQVSDSVAGVISKPFDDKILFAKVNQALSKGAGTD